MKISTNTTAENPGEVLQREIGVWGVFINVINNTVGNGIFLLADMVAGVFGNARHRRLHHLQFLL